MCECRIDGNLYELSEEIKLEKNIKHNIEIVVDRLMVKPGIENASDGFDRKCPEPVGRTSDGGCESMGRRMTFSARAFPARTAASALMKSSRRSFSFNNPFGACPECYGLGYKMEFDADLMIPDPHA